MHMKYLQGLADIYHHYKNITNPILLQFDKPNNIDELLEEKEAMRYLIGCRFKLVHGTNAIKPKREVIERALKRHMVMLKKVFDIDHTNARTHKLTNIRREYLACKHYLFQASLPAWYRKLPDIILTYNNKYNTTEN